MQFLADESCDFAVVRALRAAGDDGLAVAEISPRADDQAVLELAFRDGFPRRRTAIELGFRTKFVILFSVTNGRTPCPLPMYSFKCDEGIVRRLQRVTASPRRLLPPGGHLI